MTDSGSRRGAANLAPVLMILSFVAMIGFLVWLGMTSEGTEGTIAMEEDTAGAMDEMETGATEVTPDQLTGNAGAFVGQRVRITAEVASPVGNRAFFLDIPGSPFLVTMGTTLAEQRAGELPMGEIMVTGTLHTMTDSVISAWQEAGTISEGDVPVVEFATHFIEANRIRSGGESQQENDQGPEGGAGP